MTNSTATRPSLIPMEHLHDLEVLFRITIPEDYLDLLGHMNVQKYFTMYGEGARALLDGIGVTEDYIRERQGGNFVMKQFIRYVQEVHLGEEVTVRARIIERSEKRLHVVYFIVNETTERLASICETVTSHADLKARRSSPFPPDLAKAIDTIFERHDALPWEPPLSGAMSL